MLAHLSLGEMPLRMMVQLHRLVQTGSETSISNLFKFSDTLLSKSASLNLLSLCMTILPAVPGKA
jgi:hypothetical protein